LREEDLVDNDMVAISSTRRGGSVGNVEGEKKSSFCQNLNQGLVVRRLERIRVRLNHPKKRAQLQRIP